MPTGSTAAAWALDPFLNGDLYDDPTLVRVQLLVQWRTSGSPAFGGFYSAGLIVASGDTDSTAVPLIYPDPADDPDADWIIRTTYPVASNAPIGVYYPTLDWLHQAKTKRKVGYGEGLLLVVQNTTSSDATVALDERDLIMSG